MFLTDPVLRCIATATADVLPDRLWRFDTAEPGARGEMARLLHDTSVQFADRASHLRAILTGARMDITRILQTLADNAHLHTLGTDRIFADLPAAMARYATLEQQLLRQYGAWRAVAGAPTPHPDSHLLVKQGDPSWGVITLAGHDGGHWQVIPDEEAAACFAIGHHAAKVIGTIIPAASLFQPVAHTSVAMPGGQTEQVHGFAPCEDIQTACRSLLRWWAIRDSEHWDGRYPKDFTPDELAALAE